MNVLAGIANFVISVHSFHCELGVKSIVLNKFIQNDDWNRKLYSSLNSSVASESQVTYTLNANTECCILFFILFFISFFFFIFFVYN